MSYQNFAKKVTKYFLKNLEVISKYFYICDWKMTKLKEH